MPVCVCVCLCVSVCVAGSLNSHADPVCICACYADRLIAMQPKSDLELHCGANDPLQPKYNDCNCTVGGGVREPAGSDSIRYVSGLSPSLPPSFPLSPPLVAAPMSQFQHAGGCDERFVPLFLLPDTAARLRLADAVRTMVPLSPSPSFPPSLLPSHPATFSHSVSCSAPPRW